MFGLFNSKKVGGFTDDSSSKKRSNVHCTSESETISQNSGCDKIKKFTKKSKPMIIPNPIGMGYQI